MCLPLFSFVLGLLFWVFFGGGGYDCSWKLLPNISTMYCFAVYISHLVIPSSKHRLLHSPCVMEVMHVYISEPVKLCVVFFICDSLNKPHT